MNYIGLLSKDEIKTLCKIIGGKRFKVLFKKNFKEFSKIKPGFRADSLSDVDTVSIAADNKDKSFIFMFINRLTGKWMKEIENHLAKLKQEGMARDDDILAETLVDSFFSEQIELYFKLTQQPCSDSSLEKIKLKMEGVKNNRKKGSAQKESSEPDTKIEQLTAQISRLEKNLTSAQEEHIAAIEEHKQAKANLEAALLEAQEKLKHFQTRPVVVSSEMDDYDRRIKFDDTKKDILSLISSSEEYISLCEVVPPNYKGEKISIRHADINNKGQLELFQKNDEYTDPSENRDKIFIIDGPTEIGRFAVWNWSVSPNKNGLKTFVKSRFNPDIIPIEVVIIPNCNSEEDLASCLQKGYRAEINSPRVMFSAYRSKGKLIGILCSNKDYTSSNGITTFSDDVIMAPVYEFDDNELILIKNKNKNGPTLYQSVFAGIPIRLYRVKSEMEIVKNIVLKSISWSNFKLRGGKRSEHQFFKDYISALSTDDITDKICKSCYCTSAVANQLLSRFIEHALDYIDGKSLDDEVIISAIFASESLMSKAKDLISADWEKENHARRAEAQEKLDLLNDQLRVASGELADAQKALQTTKTEEERLTKVIQEKEQLADDVEIAVAEKIQQAKTSAAEFIASMAFTSAHSAQVTRVAPPAKAEDTSLPSSNYVVIENIVNLDTLEQHNTWSQVIETATIELLEAGVAENHAPGLASYLCAAYIEKQPLLLVGPNAREIIKAFSASLSGQKRGVLYCEGEYSNTGIRAILNSGENLVEIVNLLSSGWINRLPEILSLNDILFIATHPYAEDIQVEPKSLFSFMLPIFTEFFVDKKPAGKYSGGYFAENFEAYQPKKTVRKEVRSLSHFTMNPLIRGRIKQLLTVMHDINAETTDDDDFLFSILPLAYATMEIDNLVETIKNPQKGITISIGLRHKLQFVLGKL